MMRNVHYIWIFICLFALNACSSITPYQTQRVLPFQNSEVNKSLRTIPEPEDKAVVAVYDFRDQTGQYKPSKGISYSTAVTQGATSILIESLLDSGWFKPIERAGISNLLNERRIIQNTRRVNKDNNQLPPLLFAGVILEGGIIGYDSNVVTGGIGARYLGIGADTQFRRDEVTIYLRAVSTGSGRILESVHVTKTIISRKLTGGAFRYIGLNKLLETEVGITFNEPSTMAVTEAIDAAVRRLIVKGVESNLWNPANKEAYSTYKDQLMQRLEQRKGTARGYFGLNLQPQLREGVLTITTNFSYGSYIGSYGDEYINPGFMLQVELPFANRFSLKMNYQRTAIGATGVFSTPVNSVDLLLNAYLTPKFSLSPYISVGGGVMVYDNEPDFVNQQAFPTVSASVGLDYRFSEAFGIRAGVNYRYLISDKFDGTVTGTVNDQQWSFITGFVFNFN